MLGLAAMLLAGWRSLRVHDLKLVLAFGTVSQLGLLMVLVGLGTDDAALAGMTMLVAHALFKATLFLVVGIIDHGTGTRDLRKLAGLGRGTAIGGIAVLAAASMAGIPPFIGFVGKEAALTTLLEPGPLSGPLRSDVLAGVVVGSMFTVAYSLRFIWGAFAGKGRSAPSTAAARYHRPSTLLLAAPALLSAAALAAGTRRALGGNAAGPVRAHAARSRRRRYHLATVARVRWPLAIT